MGQLNKGCRGLFREADLIVFALFSSIKVLTRCQYYLKEYLRIARTLSNCANTVSFFGGMKCNNLFGIINHILYFRYYQLLQPFLLYSYVYLFFNCFVEGIIIVNLLDHMQLLQLYNTSCVILFKYSRNETEHVGIRIFSIVFVVFIEVNINQSLNLNLTFCIH